MVYHSSPVSKEDISVPRVVKDTSIFVIANNLCNVGTNFSQIVYKNFLEANLTIFSSY